MHADLTLLDLIVGEDLELGSETEFVHGENEPLGGVILR